MQTKAFLPPPADFTFKKTERLCSKKAFEFLFAEGKTAFVHPLKIIYAFRKTEGTPVVQAAFGVSKRNFKRAVKRNRVKRLLREAYRKHKPQAIDGIEQFLMIIYISKEIDNYKTIEDTLIKALNQIKTRIEKNI